MICLGDVLRVAVDYFWFLMGSQPSSHRESSVLWCRWRAALVGRSRKMVDACLGSTRFGYALISIKKNWSDNGIEANEHRNICKPHRTVPHRPTSHHVAGALALGIISNKLDREHAISSQLGGRALVGRLVWSILKLRNSGFGRMTHHQAEGVVRAFVAKAVLSGWNY